MICLTEINQHNWPAALELVLDRLRAEGRWPTVEVCVKKTDAPALRVYQKAGFVDSGYVDPEVPDAVNLVCKLTHEL